MFTYENKGEGVRIDVRLSDYGALSECVIAFIALRSSFTSRSNDAIRSSISILLQDAVVGEVLLESEVAASMGCASGQSSCAKRLARDPGAGATSRTIG